MKVRTLQAVTLGAGTVLELTQRQAARRAGQLAAEGGNRYRALVPVCFKAGEEFGVTVALPKALADVVETDAPAAKPVARRRPAALVDPARLDIG